MQEKAETLGNFEKLVAEENYTLEKLVLDEIKYDAREFTSVQTGYLIVGIQFFKGEVAL